MADEEPSFKVVDRRGRARDAASEAPSVSEAAPPPPAPPQPDLDAPEPRPDGPGLHHLFSMLANSAVINLGEVPDPVTGEVAIDLEQAQDAIEMLLVLREKTEGNRTDEESQLLEQILYELQTRFVQVTRGGR